MKKLFFLMMFFCLALMTQAKTQTKVVDGLAYSIDDEKKTAKVVAGELVYPDSIVIPATILVPDIDEQPLKVTAIDGNAFNGNNTITFITIYAEITEIPSNCFKKCTGLERISFGETVTSIGSNAFEGCAKLRSIVIPNGVEKIGINAFQGCSSLQKVTFASLQQLCGINFGNKNANPLSFAHHLYFSGQENEVDSIDLSETDITKIGQYAFSECWGLKSIYIPATVTTIGDDAFIFDDGKKSDFPKTSFESIESLCQTDFNSKKSNPIYYQNVVYTGKEPTAQSTIVITENCLKDGKNDTKFLGANIFVYASIVTVSLPEGIDSIGNDAFYYCENLQVANYPSLEAVKTMKYGNEHSNPLKWAQILKVENKDQSELELTNDVEPNAFVGAKWLKKVIFKTGVTTIGKNAFSGCLNMTDATFNTTTLTTIEESAFRDCRNLKSVNLPEGLTTLGKWAFRDCRKMTEVTIPESCTNIEMAVFYGCI